MSGSEPRSPRPAFRRTGARCDGSSSGRCSPILAPQATIGRRNEVLAKMAQLGMISRATALATERKGLGLHMKGYFKRARERYVLLYALLPRRFGAPIAAGILAHLFLDELGDLFAIVWPRPGPARTGPATAAAILFPLLGFQFPVLPFSSAAEHIRALADPYTLLGEAFGAVLIYLNRARLRAALPVTGAGRSQEEDPRHRDEER